MEKMIVYTVALIVLGAVYMVFARPVWSQRKTQIYAKSLINDFNVFKDELTPLEKDWIENMLSYLKRVKRGSIQMKREKLKKQLLEDFDMAVSNDLFSKDYINKRMMEAIMQ